MFRTHCIYFSAFFGSWKSRALHLLPNNKSWAGGAQVNTMPCVTLKHTAHTVCLFNKIAHINHVYYYFIFFPYLFIYHGTPVAVCNSPPSLPNPVASGHSHSTLTVYDMTWIITYCLSLSLKCLLYFRAVHLQNKVTLFHLKHKWTSD